MFAEGCQVPLRHAHTVGTPDTDQGTLLDLQEELTRLGPALLQEAKAARVVGKEGSRLDIIGEMVAALPSDAPLLETG
jgi:hypothetical protein